MKIVWKSTTRVGFGYATEFYNNMYRYYIVAQYNPTGNYQGQYTSSVNRI